ncbi:hypothetical protein HQ496_02250 [bacterium]|nr:hypothetical protein [bacterium]
MLKRPFVLGLLLVTILGFSQVNAQVPSSIESPAFFPASDHADLTKNDISALAVAPYSAKMALIKSLLLPGLGHKYVNDGQWSGWALAYTAADVSLWLSLLGGEWHRNSLITSYETLASGSANADLSGKNRSFYLNLASFESSDVFYETMLRNRAWDQIGYVSDPAFQWEWDSEESFNEYRSLRNDAESLRRRKTILIASLVVNRLLSGAISARKASRSSTSSVSMALSAPVESIPVLSLRVGF